MVDVTKATHRPQPALTQWRRQLHAAPELGFDVGATAATVADRLQSFGLDEVHRGVGRTGVVGVLRRGTGPGAIALRADMDALPIQEANTFDHRSTVDGAFHGCGHDGHTVMLLGAAQALAAEGGFDGTVVFIFQPNEENGLGAQAMIDDGLFERFPVSAVYGMHNKPGLAVGSFATRVGPMMSSEDLFEIHIQGRGGHASMPEQHIDPVIVAAEIISALQTIVSRSVAATDIAVVSVTEVVTDGARNIVPSNVTIKGDCRTFAADVQRRIEERMRSLVDGICAAHGATATVDYRNEFVPLVNTANEVAATVAAATAVVGEDNIDGDCAPWPASEDFARMLDVVPGCYVDIGNGTSGSCGSSLHNPNYDFNDDAIPIGVAYWCELVRQQLAP
jgi:hippurate hydrolase